MDLEHGADPETWLARNGFWVTELVSVSGEVEPHRVLLRYRVAPAGLPSRGMDRTVPTDADLVLAPGEQPHPFQRVAVYGLVRSPRGVLLTQMSDRTNSPGAWGLAGGGLDAGELPEEALHREIWEESGQRVDRLSPLRVTTNHWVGRSPSGRLEDFHAVRVVYRAWCAAPTDPVVHDLGGTTQASAWYAETELPGVRLVKSWSTVLPDLLRVTGDDD